MLMWTSLLTRLRFNTYRELLRLTSFSLPSDGAAERWTKYRNAVRILEIVYVIAPRCKESWTYSALL